MSACACTAFIYEETTCAEITIPEIKQTLEDITDCTLSNTSITATNVAFTKMTHCSLTLSMS